MSALIYFHSPSYFLFASLKPRQGAPGNIQMTDQGHFPSERHPKARFRHVLLRHETTAAAKGHDEALTATGFSTQLPTDRDIQATQQQLTKHSC